MTKQGATEWTLDEASEAGYVSGKDIVKYNWHDIFQHIIDEELDLGEAEEYFYTECSEAEEHNRQYSPFEWTAYEFNQADNNEELWEAYDAGISKAFAEGWGGVGSHAGPH